MKETIYAKGNSSIKVSNHAGPEEVDLLKRTVYGTHGPRYQHTGLDKKVNAITNPHFSAWQ